MKNLGVSLWVAIGLALVGSSGAAEQPPRTTIPSVKRPQEQPIEHRSQLLLPAGSTSIELNSDFQLFLNRPVFSFEKLTSVASSFQKRSNNSLVIPLLPPELIDAFSVNARSSFKRVNPIDFFQVPPPDFNAKVRIGRD